ncbi:YktB family protein [Thalassobacillus sp. CUG 92003]|uniref:YktB family protein n=1 Tax=Thalassobacillus sp. CUG 92003 TaxID=2736641 RepID=UPI0015E6FD77|nr:DUF1054 domain-containing protein [Thalassobacillus sp. CUG 92003]
MTRFEGFNQQDFNVFNLEGLEERMEAIQNQIQPKFQAIGETLSSDLSAMANNELYVHIAKHARRSVNPPDDTWLAIAHDKRGYKKHPHFQVGLFDDHVFLWLAFIYEMPNKSEVAKAFLADKDTITADMPDDFVVSLDHTTKAATNIKDADLESSLLRFRDVKKGEFLLGRQIPSDDPVLKDGEAFLQYAKETFEYLFPWYRKAFL